MKYFVVSLHRCGTRSTASYLDELGIRTKHWPVDHDGVDLQEMVRGRETDLAHVTNVLTPVIDSYQAVADVPIPVLYRELFARYAEAKFLLLYRDASDWVQSVRRKLRHGDFQPYARTVYWTYFAWRPQRVGELTDDQLTWMHGQHTADVMAFFHRVAPDKLGVFDLYAPETSRRMAAFLGVESARPFPHLFPRRRAGQPGAKGAADMSLVDGPAAPGRPWISRWRTDVSADGYSLKGYDELRCIFVRIPKTASQSVTLSLFGNLGGGHTNIRRYRRVFGREFDRYFKFTFVRNPWDRLVSAYFFMKGGGLTPEDSSWSQAHLSAFASFASFVDAWVTPENITTRHTFRPQHGYVCDVDGHLAVDYVGCFERLERDFRIVSRRLGVEAELLHENRTAGRRADYRSYYTDAMAEAVGRVYARDVEVFGYRFDRAPPYAPGLGALE